MANLRTIQFLRNATLYNSLEAARSALKAKASTLLDGSPVVGRYTVQTGESASDTEIRTILGIVADSKISFFNNTEEIDNVLDNLEFGPVGGGDASVIDFIQQTDGKISATTKNVGELTLSGYTKGGSHAAVEATDSINAAISKLENQIDTEEAARVNQFSATSAASVANENKVITDITQTNGVISATSSNITGVKLDGYTVGGDDSGKIANTDTLGGALGKLQGQINGMDLPVVSGEGEVITAVSEDDGKVSASKTAIKDVKLTGYAKDTTKSGAIEATDDIEDALSKIENQIGKNTVTAKDKSIVVETTGSTTEVGLNIRSGERVLKLDTDATSGGVYTDLDLVKITDGLPAEVKERYQLLASDDSQIGVNIDIPKDSHIVSITYITDSGDTHYQNLKYEYIDVSGNTQTTYVDMSELVLEAEFASGVTVTNHVAHGVVDPTSESFFTVGGDGFKVAGISAFVQSEIEKLDATGGTQAIAENKHVAVEVIEADGKITAVNVAESDIASASGLTQEIADREAGDTALSNRLGDGVTSANTATAQLDALRGTEDDTSGSTSIVGAKKYTDEKVADVVADLDANVSGNSTHVTVNVIEENGEITAVNVAEDNIANADDLAALSGKTITAINSSNGSITANIDDAAGCKSYNIETDSSKIKLSSFTESSGTADVAPANGDTINEALAKIYSAAKHHHITSNNNALSATVTESGTTLTVNVDNSTAHAAADDTYASDNQNMIQIKNGGLYVSSSIDCGTF